MHTHNKPASFHSSPQEAMQAPRGGVPLPRLPARGHGSRERRTSSRSSMPNRAAIVHETPMPNVGDELHHFGWNRCSSACHGPDRSHLIVPGFRSSRIHIVNVADDPRRAADREGDRAGGARSQDRLHAGRIRHTACPATTWSSACSATPRATAPAALRCSMRRVRVEGPLGGRWRDAAAQLRLLVPAAQERAPLVRVRRAERLRAGLRPRTTSSAGRYGSRLHFWNLAERKLEQTVDLGESGLLPLEVRWLHDPDAEEGFVGAALSSTMWRFRRDNGALGRRPGDRRRARRARGLALPGARPDHRPRPLDGRPLPLLLQLAARRPAPVRRLRPREPEADRPALARRRARQAERRRPRAERRPADAPALARRPPALRHQLALLDLGQPVLPRTALLAPARELRPRTAGWRSTATSSSTCTTARAGPHARTRCACRTATARRRSSSDRRPRHGAPGRGERPAARAGRRGDGDGGRDRRSGKPRPATRPASTAVAGRRSLAKRIRKCGKTDTTDTGSAQRAARDNNRAALRLALDWSLVRRPRLAQPLARREEMLGHHLHVGEHGHEVRVARPPRHDVLVQMRRDRPARHVPEVPADVERVGPVGAP